MSDERRHIRLEGSSNLRDIGGYQVGDGKQVRWGMVFRSGALWGLTEADWGWMAAQRVAVVCDLRSDHERDIAPTSWPEGYCARAVDVCYEAAHLFARRQVSDRAAGVGEMERSLYLRFAELLAPSLRGLFAALCSGEVPAIVHCTAGQDRTGLAVGLLLWALGADRATIHHDYLRSTALRIPVNEVDRASLASLADSNLVARFYTDLIAAHGPEVFTPRPLVDAAGTPLIEVAFKAIEKRWGSLGTYFSEMLGVGPPELAQLRERLTEHA